MDTKQLHQVFLQCSTVSTDTRKITPGSLFFALRGENFDANSFAAEALAKGAEAVVIDNPQYKTDDRCILVPNTLHALQLMAAEHRRYLGLPIIALTGSNGKTTTKELINVVLSKKYRTGATAGNLNNHIGVPLTLLSFTSETEIGIVEMGANHQKEIALLCEIAAPDYGYITNFGKAHLEGFGGVEGVIAGKSEMYDYLYAGHKTAFVNADDEIQMSRTSGLATFTFGSKSNADLVIDEMSANPLVRIKFAGMEVRSNLIGSYNAPNICAAIAIGTYFGVDKTDICNAIESYVPSNNRSQLMQRGTHQIILDAYNANPTSMVAALDNLTRLDAHSKVAILGDMFELGEESAAEHLEVARHACTLPLHAIWFVGKEFASHQGTLHSGKCFKTFEEAAQELANHKFPPSTILIKGSRGMALERLLEHL